MGYFTLKVLGREFEGGPFSKRVSLNSSPQCFLNRYLRTVLTEEGVSLDDFLMDILSDFADDFG